MAVEGGRQKQPAVSRGQAEVLGVVILLGITVLSVVAISVAGSTALTSSLDDSEVKRAELAMTQLDSRASLVALGSSSRQTTSVVLGGRGSSLQIEERAGWMNVSIMNSTDGSVKTVVMNVTMGAIVYDQGPVTIAYQGGGVWRQTASGSTLISPPEFHYRIHGGDYPTLTLPLVVVRGQTSGGKFVLERNKTVDKYPLIGNSSLTNPLSEGRVEITVHSEYYKAWGDYFQDRTDGNVTFDHARGTVTIALVIPTEEENSTITAGVVSGSAGTTLDIKEGAVVDSYNSSEGDYASTNSLDTRVVAVGPVILKEQARIEGNLEAGESVTLKEDAEITGNVQYGDTLTLKEGASIGGWAAQNASVTAPDSVKSMIDEKRLAFESNNDNNTASGEIQNIENGNCGGGCELTAGRYFLDRIELGESDSLTFNTSGGDVELVVLNDITAKEQADIDITGSNRVNVYLEGDMTLKQETVVSIPGDDSTQFWVYMNPGTEARLKQNVVFRGVIYGPGSDAQAGVSIRLKENGEVFGAVIGKVDAIKETHSFHYDEALASISAVEENDEGDSNVPSISYLHVSVNWIDVNND